MQDRQDAAAERDARASAEAFFAGPGEVRARCRALDWAATPLGAVSGWPQSLRTVVDLCLGSAVASFVWWGPELVQLCNDAALAIVRATHAAGLGAPARVAWADVWPVVGPLLEGVVRTGEAGRGEDVPMVPDRGDGAPPETQWFTFSYGPARDETGAVAGVFCTALETTARVRAEAGLRESQARLAAVFDALPVGVGVTDASGALLLANPAMRDYLPTGAIPSRDPSREGRWVGYAADGRRVAPTDYPGARALRGEATRPGLEMRYTGDDGRERWTRVAAVPVRDADGRVTETALVVTDIDALKRAEERQAFLLEVSDALRAEPSAEAVADRAIRMLSAHLQLDRSYIVSYRVEDDRADLVHQVGNDTVPPLPDVFILSDYPAAFRATFDQTLVIEDELERQGLSEAERRSSGRLGMRAMVAATLRKGGHTPLWSMVAVSSSPRRWTRAEIGLVEEMAERTWAAMERARAEAALRASEAKYRTLFETMGQGYCDLELVRDAAGRAIDQRYLELNPAFERLIGVQAAAARGRLASEVLPALEPSWHAAFDRIAQRGTPERIEYEVASLGRWFEVFVYPHGGDRLTVLYEDVTERRRAEEALRASEERLRLAVDATGLATFDWDLASDRLTVNERYRTLFALPADVDIKAADMLDSVVHPDDRDWVRERLAAAMDPRAPADGGAYTFEHRNQTPRGERWLLAFGQVYFAGDGDGRRAVRIIGNDLDITERKRTEAALRASEERYRALFASMDEAYAVVEVLRDDAGQWGDFRFLEVNPAFMTHTGMPYPVGRTATELLGTPNPRWALLYGQVAETGESIRVTEPELTLGRVFDLNIFRLGSPGSRRVAVLFADVTERERTEAALRESEARFRALAIAGADALYRMSPDWSEMRELDGRGFLSDTPLPSETWLSRYIHPEDHAHVLAAIAAASRERRTFELEHRVVRADGSLGWVQSRAVPLFDPAGAITEWIGAGIDVTARKEAEAALTASETRQAFLLALSDALQPLSDAAAIEGETCRLLAEHLGVDRAFYCEFRPTEGVTLVRQDYVRGDVPSLRGTYAISDFAWMMERYGHGRPVVITDVWTAAVIPDAYRAASAAAHVAWIVVPLMRDRTIVGTLCVADMRPRAWAASDVELVRDTAERLWATIERARAEAALRESEARLAAVFEALPVGIGIIDTDGRVGLSNRALSTWLPTGRMASRDPDRTARWQAWYPDGTRVDPRDFPSARALRGDYTVPGLEMLYTGDDGRAVWTQVACVPVRDERGRVTGTVTMIGDIDAAKRTAVALRESEARYRTLVENVWDYAIFLLDADGVVTEWAAGAERVTGYAAAEAVGQPVSMYYTPEDVVAGVPAAHLAEAAATGRGEWEGWRVRKGGERFWADEIATAVRDADGRLTGFTKISRDLTERRRAEGAAEVARASSARDELRRALAQAEEAERRRLARELHDQLGQELTAFRLGLAEAARLAGARVAPEDPLLARIVTLETLADRMTAGARYVALELRPPELDDLGLESALTTYVREWSARYGVAAEVAVTGMAAERPISAEAASALYRIAQEALTNVAKHAGATSVSVIVDKPDGVVRLIVEDDGRGFDAEATAARARAERRLGLVSMRERAALVGGTLEIESSPHGGGTALYVQLPIDGPAGGASHDHSGEESSVGESGADA